MTDDVRGELKECVNKFSEMGWSFLVIAIGEDEKGEMRKLYQTNMTDGDRKAILHELLYVEGDGEVPQ